MINTWHLRNAIHVIDQGGVIAYPTEAVWGLGCDPWQFQAVQRILQLKYRPQHKGLILVASRWQHIHPLLENLTDAHIDSLRNTWPGPFTWLLPDPKQWIPSWIKGEHSTVAVRISAHPDVVKLCDAVQGPIVSTSANPAGAPPALTRLKIKQYFGGQLDYILPGQLGAQTQPTQVKNLLTNRIVRLG